MNKMKKILLTVVVLLLLVVTGCNKKTSYTINYELNGGTAPYLITQYKTDDIVIFPEASKEGYFFDGWYRTPDFTGGEVTMLEGTTQKNVTVYAKWNPITYTVEYVLNGGSFKTEPKTDGNYEEKLTLSIPEREGYVFLGWYKTKDLSGDPITYIPLNYKQNISVYASWASKISTVTYMIGDIFESKEELFTSFFTDFYNYIINYKKAGSSLRSQGVNSVEDFLEAASYYDPTSGAGMGKIGNLAGSYYVTKNIGGKLEDQTENSFIGWCLKNDRYVDFIYFMEEFFYWWRLDEGYTNGPDDPQGTGSDFFASSWASLVDTAKFFYFTKETLPTYFKTKGHIPAMYDKIPSLIISKRGTLETEYNADYGLGISFELTITGKRLVGWTLTKGDTTNVITRLEEGIYNDIVLYPVWEEIE